MSDFVNPCKDGLLLDCHVSPSSSRNEAIKGDGFLKIKITAAPVDGKANKKLAEFLGGLLKAPKGNIEIVKGETGKRKKVLVKGISMEELNRRLEKIK